MLDGELSHVLAVVDGPCATESSALVDSLALCRRLGTHRPCAAPPARGGISAGPSMPRGRPGRKGGAPPPLRRTGRRMAAAGEPLASPAWHNSAHDGDVALVAATGECMSVTTGPNQEAWYERGMFWLLAGSAASTTLPEASTRKTMTGSTFVSGRDQIARKPSDVAEEDDAVTAFHDALSIWLSSLPAVRPCPRTVVVANESASNPFRGLDFSPSAFRNRRIECLPSNQRLMGASTFEDVDASRAVSWRAVP